MGDSPLFDEPSEEVFVLFRTTRADDPKWSESRLRDDGHFGYPLICEVARSDTEQIGGDIRARYGKWSGAQATRHFAYRIAISEVRLTERKTNLREGFREAAAGYSVLYDSLTLNSDSS